MLATSAGILARQAGWIRSVVVVAQAASTTLVTQKRPQGTHRAAGANRGTRAIRAGVRALRTSYEPIIIITSNAGASTPSLISIDSSSTGKTDTRP